MLVWGRGGVVTVSTGCDCMGGTRGSGVVSSVDDVYSSHSAIVKSLNFNFERAIEGSILTGGKM